MDHWIQFDDALIAGSVARALSHSERFWDAVYTCCDGGDARDAAVALLPAEGAARDLIASHIEFASKRFLDLGSPNEHGEPKPVDRNDDCRALIRFELMNRAPTISPTGSLRRRHMRELDYAESLEILEHAINGRCLYPGCDDPAGDRFGEPVYRTDEGRKRSAGRSWCCGTHAEWETSRGKGTAAVKRVRDLLRSAARVSHESFAEWSERRDAMARVFDSA